MKNKHLPAPPPPLPPPMLQPPPPPQPPPDAALPAPAPYARVAFGNGEATRCTDAGLLKIVKIVICKSLRASPRDALLLPLPVSPEAHHVEAIKRSSYLVSEKADGLRYCMVLCMMHVAGEWRRVCALYARDQSVLILQLSLADALFEQGSVFDTELVRGWDGVYRLLIFDCYMLNGRPLSDRSFQERTLAAHRLVHDHSMPHGADAVQLHHKRFVALHGDAGAVLVRRVQVNSAESRAFEWPTDGYILLRPDAPVRRGTNATMFKFKFHHTLDLRLVPEPDAAAEPAGGAGDDARGFALCSRGQGGAWVAHAHGVPAPRGAGAGDVVECKIELNSTAPGGAVFTPLHVRRDKNGEPNSSFVVDRTMHTVKDNVNILKVMCR